VYFSAIDVLRGALGALAVYPPKPCRFLGALGVLAFPFRYAFFPGTGTGRIGRSPNA